MAAKKKPADADSDIDIESEQTEAAQPLPLLKRLPLKLMLAVVAGVLVLGGGAAAYMMVSGKNAGHAVAPAKPPVFVDLPDTLVNLSSAAGERTQYLKVKVVLELPDQAMAQQVQPLIPRVTDAFQTYMRELRPTDLDGSAGLYRLKEELTRRVNASIAPSRVNAILFKEIIVQ
jgi:flagellar FliL protein